MNIHELYGVLAERLENEINEHLRTVDVLRQLKAETLDIARLIVTERGWEITPEEKPVDGTPS